MDTTERPAAPQGLVSRRTLVRAGATAAWSVPLVQVVAAAPARAVGSVGSTTLQYTGLSGTYTSATDLQIVSTVKNSGTTAAKNLQVSLTLPVTASAVTVGSGSWTAAAASSTPTKDWVLTAIGDLATGASSAATV